jgi:hypothetical protein
MTHFNFIPVNARLVPKSPLPETAPHSHTLFESRLPARRSAPAPYLFGGHLWALLALDVVQSPSKPVRPAMAPLLGSVVSVERVSSLLFLLSSSLTICSGVSSRFTNSPQTNQKKTSLAKSCPFIRLNASWISTIQYHIQHSLTHFCLAQQTTNHVSQHSQQGKRSSTLICSVLGDGRAQFTKPFYSISKLLVYHRRYPSSCLIPLL